jgi:hypothetical protein
MCRYYKRPLLLIEFDANKSFALQVCVFLFKNYSKRVVFNLNKIQKLVKMDMDVNEHERLSNITLKTQIQVKEQCFYGCSAFNSHSGIYNNEQNSYPSIKIQSDGFQCVFVLNNKICIKHIFMH